MDNQQPKEKKSNLFFAYGSPQFVIGATLLNMFLNSDFKDDPDAKLSIKEEKRIQSVVNVLFILFLTIPFVFMFTHTDTYKKLTITGYQTAEEVKLETRKKYDAQTDEYKLYIKCNCD